MAKVVFKEDDAEQFSLLTKLRASYQVPSGFNVATGEPLSSMQPLNFIKKDIDKDNAGRVLFTNYVFTPSTGKQEMETISFQFSLGSTVLNREIPAGAVALTRNQQLTVKGELIGDGTFVPEEPEPSELPQVGDFSMQTVAGLLLIRQAEAILVSVWYLPWQIMAVQLLRILRIIIQKLVWKRLKAGWWLLTILETITQRIISNLENRQMW